MKYTYDIFDRKKNGATTINLPFLLFLSVGSLSKDVFEGRTSTGSEPFSLFICLDANKFVLLSFFSLMRRIYPSFKQTTAQ